MASGDTQTLPAVHLEHSGGFEFRVTFAPELAQLVMDEAPPLGSGAGPGASQVLGAAVGNCLSASLLLCLQKSRVEMRSMRTRVDVRIGRNERGRFRVLGTSVEIRLDIGGEDAAAKFARCASMFEDFCMVTASVRQGVPVDVAIVDADGRELHRSASA